MTLGEQVREARQKVGITQATLSARSGVSRFTIQGIEQDRFVPSLQSLLKLTRELRATFLFEEAGTEIVFADATAFRGKLIETLQSLKGRR